MQSLAAPTEAWRRPLWLALLVAASIGFSLGFACAAPLAAFASIAALTLPRRDGLLLVETVWLASQVVGYGFLDYPWDANSLAWGVAIGLAALAATLSARDIARRFAGRSLAATASAVFLAAFAAFEACLFTVALFLGGIEDFGLPVVAEIFALNAAALLGLLALNRLGALAGMVGPAPVPARLQ